MHPHEDTSVSIFFLFYLIFAKYRETINFIVKVEGAVIPDLTSFLHVEALQGNMLQRHTVQVK